MEYNIMFTSTKKRLLSFARTPGLSPSTVPSKKNFLQ